MVQEAKREKLLQRLAIRYMDPHKLIAHTDNARLHSRQQIKKIVRCIKKFGFMGIILIDRNNRIIAGHARVEAARILGMPEVPVVYIDHLGEAQIRAYIIADNRLAELSEWDPAALKAGLQEIIALDGRLDLTITGFDTPEIDVLLLDINENPVDPADVIPEVDDTRPPVTKPGYLWKLRKHRILCSDALVPRNFECLMGEKLARMIITDPPYNVPVDGHVSGLGKNKHAEFAMASGEMSSGEFTAFLQQVFENLADFSMDGGIHFVWMDWRHARDILMAGQSCYSELKNICVWNKDNGGMGSLYRSKHELVFVFKNGKAPHINNVELGKHGRYRTNVWDYAGQNTFHQNREAELALHPTVKPVAMFADAILDCSKRGSIILDPFGGSGTTLIAAQKTGRRARLMEIDPKYVDVTIRRWQEMTGEDAIHVASGKTFNQILQESDHD